MKLRNTALVIALVSGLVTMSGCSLFKKSSSSGDEQAPVADASTDALPQASAEAPPPADPAPADAAPADAPPPVDTAAAAPSEPAPADAPPAPAEAAPADVPPPVDTAAAPPAAEPAPGDVPPAPVADAAPAPEPAAPVSGGSVASQTYSVGQGETLMKIAFEKFGDLYKWKEIYEANRDVVKDPNAIPAGTVLKIDAPASPVVIERNGEKYLIKRGDTLGTISGDVYGTRSKWKKLWENNRQMIHDPNMIFAGFYLYYIPEAPAPGQQQQLSPRAPASTGQPVVDPVPAAPAGQ